MDATREGGQEANGWTGGSGTQDKIEKDGGELMRP